MAEADSLENLQQKLTEHRAQLADVEAILEKTPQDKNVLELRDELKRVIAMSEDLVKIHADQSIVPSFESKWEAGNRAMCLYTDNKYYLANIDEILPNDMYIVTYLRYGDTAEVPGSSLKPWSPPPHHKLGKGTLVHALWKEDGLFYDAVIEEVMASGLYRVKYVGYKKKRADVLARDLQLREDQTVAKVAQVEGELVIPDRLKAKPTDSERMREIKKRKLKMLKHKHKQTKIEQESLKRKKSWMDFQKSVKRSRSAIKKKSIFAVPEEPDGVVGVVGSGRGTTHFRDIKRHEFDHLKETATAEEEKQ